MSYRYKKYQTLEAYFSIAVIACWSLHSHGQVSPFQSGAYLPGVIGVRDYSYPEI